MARAFGRANGTGSLTRVLVRPPDPSTLGAWREYGWRGEPDPEVIVAEHEGFRAALAGVGAEVVLGTTPGGSARSGISSVPGEVPVRPAASPSRIAAKRPVPPRAPRP